MTLTDIAIVGEGALLTLLAVFVVALLRSHAEILRRLAALDPAGSLDGYAGGVVAPADPPRGETRAERAVDIVGETLDGQAVKLSLGAGAPDTLLAFLGSGCGGCQPLWQDLREASLPVTGARVVVVTKGTDRESLSRLRELAPTGAAAAALRGRAEVLMATAAWSDYAVPATPHFVLVQGAEGRIAGRGSANSWEQIMRMLGDSARDDELMVQRSAGSAPTPPDGRSGGPGTSGRAARAEAALAQAGIAAGHPSLHPSRRDPAEEAP